MVVPQVWSCGPHGFSFDAVKVLTLVRRHGVYDVRIRSVEDVGIRPFVLRHDVGRTVSLPASLFTHANSEACACAGLLADVVSPSPHRDGDVCLVMDVQTC
jgi:hypothetical protein